MTQHSGFDAVCFDCDSTLTRIEGIDELARRAGCEAEIAALTDAAMNGELALDAVYAARMERVRPDRAALDWLAARYSEQTVPGAAETIATLQRLGKTVYVVSGGLLQPVAAFACGLRVDQANVRAVAARLDGAGSYTGFDAASPLTRNDGKAIICRELAAKHGRVALVGDGVTDVAARAGGAYVVGFGGVVRREAVEKAADAFIAAPNLTGVVGALLTDDEKAKL